MTDLKLSTLAIILGLGMIGLNIMGVLKPAEFASKARKFPRWTPIGVLLMLVATAWFEYYLSIESVSDFASFKKPLYIFFAAVGVGACIFVQDYLPVRGLAVVMLLAGKLMTDTARWADTEWRLVIITIAYIWVIAGMWFTISPYRMRDLINWATVTPERTRLLSGLRVALGIFILVLGVTVFRAAEQRGAAGTGAARPRLGSAQLLAGAGAARPRFESMVAATAPVRSAGWQPAVSQVDGTSTARPRSFATVSRATEPQGQTPQVWPADQL